MPITKQINKNKEYTEQHDHMDVTLRRMRDQIDCLLDRQFREDGDDMLPIFNLAKTKMVDDIVKEMKISMIIDGDIDYHIKELTNIFEMQI